MSDIITMIMTIFATIVYFFGSIGIGTNPAQKILITDANGEAMAGVEVYYQSPKKDVDYLKLEKIGTTDKDGYVEWDHQCYGDQSIYVYTEEYQWNTSIPIGDFDVTISRTDGETIELEIDEDYVYTPHWNITADDTEE